MGIGVIVAKVRLVVKHIIPYRLTNFYNLVQVYTKPQAINFCLVQ